LDLLEQRERLYRWLRECLIGADDGDAGDCLNGIQPLERFHTAILFPVVRGEYGIDHALERFDEGSFEADVDGEEEASGQVAAGTTPRRRRIVPPSSVGFSFFVTGERVALQLIPAAVRYRPVGERDATGRFLPRTWTAHRLGGEDEACSVVVPDVRQPHTWRQPVFHGTAELLVLWRPLEAGWLVTVSLSNTEILEPDRSTEPDATQRNEKALFQVSLECCVDRGRVGPYPGIAYGNLTPEEQELELQYRAHRVYAIGHGAAVDWAIDRDGPTVIRTDFLPRVEVPQVSTEVAGVGQDVLSLRWLEGIEADCAGRCDELAGFVARYGEWVEGVARQAGDFDPEQREAASRILQRMRTTLDRMGDGVRVLREDAIVRRAFALANRAMRRQMAQADAIQGRAPADQRWRPFQLAFQLLALESTVNEHSDCRDILDLIWFPTGGGKTEAYLGLMAILICWRRMKFGTSGGGTAVLMRYTLRLLTKDQFRRAARLICALELLRRETPELGPEPISLGLWVGEASSPNSFVKAKEALDEAIENRERPPGLLVVEACPWCGQAFDAARNYEAGADHFRLRCTNAGCELGREPSAPLPCNVVDAALYQDPPTLLLATVDKLARLAWDARASVFFGCKSSRPPELIIQDELHLIASALGSVAGLYEAAIETVLSMRGVQPKYVASTATIRMAGEQVRRLYAREAAVFPPRGLDCDDAFFARTVPLAEQPGRLYVGYLAPARDRAHCLAPLAGALLSAPEVLFGGSGKDVAALLDAWWTVLVYHGSLKGVGVSRNALHEIETFIARYQAERRERMAAAGADGMPSGAGEGARWERLAQLADRLTQLTSHMPADENARTFDRLRLPWTDPDGLDLVLATNMVSVGLDVSRLSVMIVNGQPLTTAEYIQASSRVGRGDVPGLVVANYYRDQARSLSHYEAFRGYHESFYRHVEPTSVTPFTYQARLRALHAALVVAVRHAGPRLAANAAAGDFDPADPFVARIVDELARRCRRADPERSGATEQHLDSLVGQWAEAARRCREQRERLVYHGPDRDRRDQRLLHSHDARHPGLWATLNNMRNVENNALVKVL